MEKNILRLSQIEEAQRRIAPYVIRTPLRRLKRFEEEMGWKAPIYLKLDNLQNTGSFKVRGAANKILEFLSTQSGDVSQRESTATAETKKNILPPPHLIAASAGNHAQAVAYMAKHLGLDATIVMPETTPLLKVLSTQMWGARVVLKGLLYDEAYQAAQDLLGEIPNSTYIHAYADLAIMAGQGTLALELQSQLYEQGHKSLEKMQFIVPIGGGGLISGVSTALRATLKSDKDSLKIYGVVAQAYDVMAQSIEAQKILLSKSPARKTLAEGLAVKSVHPLNFEHIQRNVDALVRVDEEEIASAIFYLMEKVKVVAEGAGAAGFAALQNRKIALNNHEPVVVVICGGNIDMSSISSVLERAMYAQGRWARLQVCVDDRPLQLARAAEIVGHSGCNVRHVQHDRGHKDTPVGHTQIIFEIETRGPEDLRKLKENFEAEGWSALVV